VRISFIQANQSRGIGLLSIELVPELG